MVERLGYTTCMGSELRSEVERQLLDDLAYYGVNIQNCQIDWSNTCPEGHRTAFLDGELENWSDVNVMREGSIIAQGWIDFIHGGENQPLFVFWYFLTLFQNQEQKNIKDNAGIPKQIWEKLPESTRELCAVTGNYDSRWSKDPLVLEWIQGKTK